LQVPYPSLAAHARVDGVFLAPALAAARAGAAAEVAAKFADPARSFLTLCAPPPPTRPPFCRFRRKRARGLLHATSAWRLRTKAASGEAR